MIKNAGAFGWMCDFGEYLPFDAKVAGGDAERIHNEFPTFWAKINQKALEKTGMENEIMYFMRSSWLETPGMAGQWWLGDQLTSWDHYDGMRSALNALLNLPFSGVMSAHSDIGGYSVLDFPIIYYVRTKELLMRWAEMSAFSDSIMRTHPGSNPGACA